MFQFYHQFIIYIEYKVTNISLIYCSLIRLTVSCNNKLDWCRKQYIILSVYRTPCDKGNHKTWESVIDQHNFETKSDN